ncbi:unnamed protein product, partial [Allacma fusca]
HYVSLDRFLSSEKNTFLPLATHADAASNDEDEKENNEDGDINWEDYREYKEYEISVERSESVEAEYDVIYEDICDWSKEKLPRLTCLTQALQLVIKECLKKNPRRQENISYTNKLICVLSRVHVLSFAISWIDQDGETSLPELKMKCMYT